MKLFKPLLKTITTQFRRLFTVLSNGCPGSFLNRESAMIILGYMHIERDCDEPNDINIGNISNRIIYKLFGTKNTIVNYRACVINTVLNDLTDSDKEKYQWNTN